MLRSLGVLLLTLSFVNCKQDHADNHPKTSLLSSGNISRGQCKGDVPSCTNQLASSISNLIKYKTKCKDGENCDVIHDLMKMRRILQLRLAGSRVDDTSDCADRKCLTLEVFRLVKYLLAHPDTRLKMDCEKCAVKDLLKVLKTFVVKIKSVVTDSARRFSANVTSLRRKSQRSADCDFVCVPGCEGEWACLLADVKKHASQEQNLTCNECNPGYSCSTCKKERGCGQCAEFNNCEPCPCDPCKNQCDKCIATHSCGYCKNNMNCNCKDECEICLREKECTYCKEKYGCTCQAEPKTSECENCLKYSSCTHCKKIVKDCQCEDECTKCLKYGECSFCKKKYGCECDDPCTECLKYSDNNCNLCKEKFGCNCTAPAQLPPQLPSYKPRKCQKCFVPRHVECPPSVTWWRAYFNCKNHGMKLASIRSQEENNALLSLIIGNPQNHGYDYWIGGSCYPYCAAGRRDVWYWTDRYPRSLGTNRDERYFNDKINFNSFDNWGSNQPNNENTVRTTLAMTWRSGLKWDDLDLMDNLSGYVCEKKCDDDCDGGPEEVVSTYSFQGDTAPDLSIYWHID